jgi:DNA polymerase-3 subunit chi
LLARSALGAGERLVVVSADPAQIKRISEELWTRQPDSFLAHGPAGGPHDARQPILLAPEPVADNGARFCLLADGQWRETAGMTRLFLLFGADRIDDARGTWCMLGQREGVERRYWRQDGGKWREGP